MILEFNQLKDIVLNNPNKELVLAGIKKNKRLRMHMYGEGLDKHLEVIKGFEKDWVKELRVKYTRSNKDLFSRLGRPEDKVYSARGGSIYYNLPEAQEKKARLLSMDVRDGYSIREWIENFWRPHYKDDPCGVLFLELLPQQQALLAKQQGRSFVYPTYKAITCIHDYQPKGVALDYISFKVEKAEKRAAGLKDEDQVFRVVDDAFDYYVKQVNNDIVILWDLTIKNFFGQVPGMINSDFIDPDLENSFLSLFDDIVGLADEFLRKGSIKVTHDFLHGFPKYSEFADDCADCKGTGFMDAGRCPSCKGTGKSALVRVSDIKLLSWPQDKDTPVIKPTEVGGYIEPSKNYYEIATADLSLLENYMTLTLWGTQSKVKTEGTAIGQTGDVKTATEVMDEVKPQADRLIPISKMVEKRIKFILDAVIRLQVTPDYPGSSVNTGRRYMLEGPDAIWEKYADSRAKGVAISALDDLLVEYYEAKFTSDPVKLQIQLKLMKVEPFVHYKATEIQAFRLGPEDYKAKIFYGEWLKLQNDGLILSQDIPTLIQSLNEFAAKKQIEENKPEPIAA